VSTRALPYRTPAPGRIATEPWFLIADTAQELPPFVDGWDYTTNLRLVRRIRIDRSGACADAGLPPDAPLEICVRVRPSTSLLRAVVARIPIPTDTSQPRPLEAVLAGPELAGTISIETLLELGQHVQGTDPFVASHAGSILWRDETSTALEGDSGLVPMAPVSFAQAGFPQAAAWYISLDTARWDWAALGSLLVLLNTDNPAVATALDHPDDRASTALWDTLGADLVCDLIGRAVEDEAFTELYPDQAEDPAGADEHSLAALVRALARAHLTRPTETVDEALERLGDLHRRDPSMYRAVVQDGLRYPRSVAG
jgi:hypothetical protein